MAARNVPVTNVALFGGSFDPVHYGHVSIACYLASMGFFDSVQVMPVYKHAYGKDLLLFEHRYEMCRLAMGWIPKTNISDIERQSVDIPGYPEVNYTYHTARRIKEIHPNWNLHVVCGADVDINSWDLGKELLEIVTPFVLDRAGVSESRVIFPSISSTEIRESLKDGSDVAKRFLTKPVYDYIKENKLYQ